MPVRLSTTISKISLMANSTNQMLVTEFYEYMKNNDCSEKHINNNLKTIMNRFTIIVGNDGISGLAYKVMTAYNIQPTALALE